MGSNQRCVCIHGHFYQPPRENPWLEAIEVQDSARPCHDWNERILEECYAPNAFSRILDEEGRIRGIANNYERVSFNFGPTLLGWLEQAARGVYQAIREADRASAERLNGHGNALAQVYNHIIMPLAPREDKEVQVAWGIVDFEHHFGRYPEGMWLAECGVDTETLEVLVSFGIQYVVLAPQQARACRPDPHQPWEEIGAGIDPTRAYRIPLPSGRWISAFFYDGPVSRAVAFEGLLHNGKRFADRLLSGFSDRRDHPQLMHIATDGESYGHHHRYGEMALTAALNEIERHGVTITNYAAFLEDHPPTWEAMIWDMSSWSCPHGVERWRSNCGCGKAPGMHLDWRTPLRDALTWLREEFVALFEDRVALYLPDGWEALHDYIGVILDRSHLNIDRFLQRHGAGADGIPEAGLTRGDILSGFEMMRQAQLMFTSCAWFFEEVSRLEGMQNLKYAARGIQLAARLGKPDLLDEFLLRLEGVPSNHPSFRHARDAWDRHVASAIADSERVAAHFAVGMLLQLPLTTSDVPAYECEIIDQHIQRDGVNGLVVGTLRTRSRLVDEYAEAQFAIIHSGTHDFLCCVTEGMSPAAYARLVEDLQAAFEGPSIAKLLLLMDRRVGGQSFSLADLMLEDRRRVMAQASRENLAHFQEVYQRLYDDNRRLMVFSRGLDIPPPPEFLMAATAVLAHRVKDLLECLLADALAGRLPDREALDEMETAIAEARNWGIELPDQHLGPELRKVLEQYVMNFDGTLDGRRLEAANRVLDLADTARIDLDLWGTQNRLYWMLVHPDASVPPPDQEPTVADSAVKNLLRLVDRLNLSPQLSDPLTPAKRGTRGSHRIP